MRIAARIGWILLSLLIGGLSARADTRVALVIGNSTYRHSPVLPNPVNDASDVSASLRQLGFKVTTLIDAKFDDMRRALIDFGRQAHLADMAVIYYAGHGIQVAGENWLIPIDAQLVSEVDVESETIGLQSMVKLVSTTTKLGLVILDACRNNPFVRSMRLANASRSIQRGLAQIEPSENVLVAYAARDGTVARDGSGRNSPFTASLLKNIETPRDVRFLFARVRDDVMAATSREQQPFTYGSLSSDDICLSTCSRGTEGASNIPATAPSQVKPDSGPATSIADLRRDYEFALQVDTVEGWNAFLKQYPSGFYADLARGHLGKKASVKSAVEPPRLGERDGARVEKPRPDNVATAVNAPDPGLKNNNAAQYFMLKVCNKSSRRASVAAMGRTSAENEDWHVEGWWNVPPRQCSNLKRYIKGKVYLFAQEDGNPSMMWHGDALRTCVASRGPFDRVNRDEYKCAADERLVTFSMFSASDESFVWNLSPLKR